MNRFLFFPLLAVLLWQCQSPAPPASESSGTTDNQDTVQITEIPANASEEITFEAADGLTVYADLYHISGDSPVVVLCHQARYNKTAYRETAPKLNELGFNCIATDQRSGGMLNDVENKTHQQAVAKNLPTNYLDAEPDIVAAINFAYEKYEQPVILVGSSYSASLALKIAAGNDKVAGVAAFSPGEYFENELNVAEAASGITSIVFVTSSKQEAPQVEQIIADCEADTVYHFVPEEEGLHGAKALWESTDNHEAYWNAFRQFLNHFIENTND